MKLTLTEKVHLIDNVWSFRFRPSEPISWTAGQFIQVELPHPNPDDEGQKRWFTVSSAPFEQYVQITTRVTSSTFKQALDALKIGGDLTLLAKPDGDFIWQDSQKRRVFVAGGIGITPLRSILAQRLHDNQPLAVTLIYGSRTADIPFRQELDRFVKSDSAFEVNYVVGDRLTATRLNELVPGIKDSLVYLSGPEPLVEALGDELRAAGHPDDGLKQDFFPNYTESNY